MTRPGDSRAAPPKDAPSMFERARIACERAAFEEALTWFQRASAAGHTRSFYWMAKLYWRGQGVRPNLRMAELLLQQGAAQKDPACCRAVRLLGWQRRRRR
jgi:TPR repeat protein